MFLLSSADIIVNEHFSKNYSEQLSECQTVWSLHVSADDKSLI